MISLYSSKYTLEDLATLACALDNAMLRFSGCAWDCSECAYKRPCRDLSKLSKHVHDLIAAKGGTTNA